MYQVKRTAAGIVTYNPDVAGLNRNIESIKSQVGHVYVFDNGSDNVVDIKKLETKNVTIVTSSQNIGIAAALNRIFKMCDEEGYYWVLTLDQDSVCLEKHVEILLKWAMRIHRVGIVAPIIVDRDVGIIGHNPQKEYLEVNTCITSGALTLIEAWKEVNGFDERMFIDGVDFDFCYSIRKKKYKVVQIKEAKLLHKIGKSEKRQFLFWSINIKGHNAVRKYYMARNRIYLPIKHHLWFHLIRGNLRNIKQLMIIAIYENEKREKIKSTVRGWKDGYKL